MKKLITLLLLLFLNVIAVFSQNIGTIKGRVIDAQTRESLPFVSIIVEGTTIGDSSKENGEFTIENVPLGYVKVVVSFLGYQTLLSDDYLVTIDKTPFILIALSQSNEQLDEVVIQSKLFKKSIESPVSVQSLGIAEIEKNPGGNRDILKVLQSLPGVASNPSFRNDIILEVVRLQKINFI